MSDNSTDISSRPWVRMSQVRGGDTVTVDGGFTCMPAHSKHEVREDSSGLFVFCEEGKHFLDGQADDGEHIIGFYPEGKL